MIGVRRHLHVHPESSGEEWQTTTYLSELLTRGGYHVRRGPDERGFSEYTLCWPNYRIQNTPRGNAPLNWSELVLARSLISRSHQPAPEQPAVQAPVGPLGLTRVPPLPWDQRARSKSGRRTTNNRSHGDHRNSEIPAKHAGKARARANSILRAVVQAPVGHFGVVAPGSPDDRSKTIPAP
jgi:hypothetical protein